MAVKVRSEVGDWEEKYGATTSGCAASQKDKAKERSGGVGGHSHMCICVQPAEILPGRLYYIVFYVPKWHFLATSAPEKWDPPVN